MLIRVKGRVTVLWWSGCSFLSCISLKMSDFQFQTLTCCLLSMTARASAISFWLTPQRLATFFWHLWWTFMPHSAQKTQHYYRKYSTEYTSRLSLKLCGWSSVSWLELWLIWHGALDLPAVAAAALFFRTCFSSPTGNGKLSAVVPAVGSVSCVTPLTKWLLFLLLRKCSLRSWNLLTSVCPLLWLIPLWFFPFFPHTSVLYLF